MRSARIGVLLTATLATVTLGALPVSSSPVPTDARTIEHGRYLVQQAALCADCHGSRLHGDRLDFLAPGLPVARYAPRIAGLPQFATAAQAVTFMETGVTPGGKQARPPMPQYRFAPADAVAIVAYLKQLR